MKIAIIHEDLSKKGGAENLIIWYSAEMKKLGYDVTLFTGAFDSKLWSNEYTDNLKVHVAKQLGFTRNPFMYEINGREALRLVKEYDIVIIHVWLNSSLSIAFRKNKRIQKWVWFCEEPPRFVYYNEIDQPLVRHNINNLHYVPHRGLNIIKNHATRVLLPIFKLLDKIFVKNTFNKIITNSRFTSGNIKTIYNLPSFPAHLGIGTHYVVNSYKNMKAEHGCDFLFFFSGRLDPTKNLKRVFQAFSRIDTRVNYKFIIAGNGQLKEFLSRKISKLGLEDRIKLVGFVSDEDLVSYMNSADIIVYLPINEPFGLVPIEAMACGRPSLVSATGGPSETIKDGKTGFHANPLDVDDIARKIGYILNHPEDLIKMRNTCRDCYEKDYTLNAGVTRFLDRLLKK